MNFVELFIQQWQQQSIGEIFAVLFALAYVWLAAQESIWCWWAGFLSTTLYVYIFWDVTLFFQMLLNVYYMAMAVWGIIHWSKKGADKVSISRMNRAEHLRVLIGGLICTSLVFLIVSLFYDYDLVFLDITLAVFSLITTYLTVTKKLENWCYWSVINIVSVVLFYDRELYLTATLMVMYLALALRGFIHWHRVYRQGEHYAYE